MKLQGYCVKLGDNINTDFIISGRYKFSITDIKELAKHIMEDIDPAFPSRVTPGKTILVAGSNFGMGSSREQAPLVIKEAGIVCVVASSFARIFFRNAFNIGLPLVEMDTSSVEEKDSLSIDLDKGLVTNVTRQSSSTIKPLPRFMQQLLREGGMVNFFSKHHRLPQLG